MIYLYKQESEYNMNRLKIEEKSLTDESKIEIIDSYNEIFRLNRNRLVDLIDEIIHNYMSGFSTSKIEYIVDDFLDEMKQIVVRRARIIEDKLYENYRQLNKNLESESKSKKDNINSYLRGLADIYNSSKVSNHPEINEIYNEFIRTITRYLGFYFDPFADISQYKMESIIDDIYHDLRGKLAVFISQIIEAGDKKMLEVLTKNCQKTIASVEKYNARNKAITEDDIKPFLPVITQNNYQIIKKEGRYYIRDLKSGKDYQFTIEGANLTIEGNKIIFSTDGEKNVFNNKGKNKTIVTDKNSISYKHIIKKGNGIPYDITYTWNITKSESGYIFTLNNKPLDNKLSMLETIDVIKAEAPKYYEQLLQDEQFRILLHELEENKKQQTEIEVDYNTNNVSINAGKMKEIKEKFKIIGYDLLEKNGTYYLKNLTTGEERKMVGSYKKWGIGMEGVPAEQFNVIMNFTINSGNHIEHGRNEFKNGNTKLTFRNSLKSFALYVGNVTYYIDKMPEGIKCQKKVGQGQVNSVNENEVFDILEVKLPYLADHLREYLNNLKDNSNSNSIPTR